MLRAKTHTIVHTREHNKDEESVGSSYYITICDNKCTSLYMKVENMFVDVHSYYHISFNDCDPQEDKNVEDASPELEEGVKNTVDILKQVNLSDDDDNDLYI